MQRDNPAASAKQLRSNQIDHQPRLSLLEQADQRGMVASVDSANDLVDGGKGLAKCLLNRAWITSPLGKHVDQEAPFHDMNRQTAKARKQGVQRTIDTSRDQGSQI